MIRDYSKQHFQIFIINLDLKEINFFNNISKLDYTLKLVCARKFSLRYQFFNSNVQLLLNFLFNFYLLKEGTSHKSGSYLEFFPHLKLERYKSMGCYVKSLQLIALKHKLERIRQLPLMIFNQLPFSI